MGGRQGSEDEPMKEKRWKGKSSCKLIGVLKRKNRWKREEENRRDRKLYTSLEKKPRKKRATKRNKKKENWAS